MADDEVVVINGRRYPSRYPPGGTDPDLNEAWEILDVIDDGVLSDDMRAFLAGVITGAFKKRAGRSH